MLTSGPCESVQHSKHEIRGRRPGFNKSQAPCYLKPCCQKPNQGISVKNAFTIITIIQQISHHHHPQVKIANARKGLVHVSQNIPTKSALSVSLVRPEDVIIQVDVNIVISNYFKIITHKLFISELPQVAAVGPKESSMSFNLVIANLNLNHWKLFVSLRWEPKSHFVGAFET